MKKSVIAKTAVCFWSEKYKEFIVESPLFEGCSGVGATEAEAWQVFQDLLSDAYEAYLEGRVPGYSRPGRPTKGGVPLNTNVQLQTKDLINRLSEEFGCSHGEVVDYLAFFYVARREQPAHIPQEQRKGRAGAVAERTAKYKVRQPPTVEELARRVEVLESKMGGKRRTR